MMAASADNNTLPDGVRRLLWLAAVAVAGIILTNLALAIASGHGLNHVAAAWTSLAVDLRDGIFYRPMFDPSSGYGGTRFFPLFFTLHGVAMMLGLSPLAAGYLVALSSAALVATGLTLLLRRLGVATGPALVLLVLLMSTASMQHGLQTIRGDLLPLALNLLGMAVYLGRGPEGRRLLLAALCFTLAVATKLTAVHGIAALGLWLLAQRRPAEAIRLGLATGVGYALLAVSVVGLSDGRIVDIFATCTSSGTSLGSLVRAPLQFIDVVSADDSLTFLLMFAALATYAMRFRQGLSLPALYFLVTLGITTFLFASQGIGANHLVDLAAAALLLCGYSLRDIKGDARIAAAWMVIVALGFGALMTVSPLRKHLKAVVAGETRHTPELVTYIGSIEQPVLMENAFPLILAGKRPYMIDSFMLRIYLQGGEAQQARLAQQLEEQQFGAIVFDHNPAGIPGWYENFHYGRYFLTQMFLHYRLARELDGRYIYEPIGR